MKRRNLRFTGVNNSNCLSYPKEKGRQINSPTSKREIPIRIFSRAVVVLSLLIIVYFSTKGDSIKIFAKQSERIGGKGQIVECSQLFLVDMDLYDGCFPKRCKRFVTDMVISALEANQLLDIAKRGFALGKQHGGASILDLHSGTLSFGDSIVDLYQLDEVKKIFTQDDFNIFRAVKEKIKIAISNHFMIHPGKVYLTHPTYFSQITPGADVYPNEYWHPVVDMETKKNPHYTVLVYLTDYGVDFNGGRFLYVEERYNRSVEPRRGRVCIHTSGPENLNYVEKVTSGARYAMTISFTCNQLHSVNDPSIENFDK